MKNLTRSAEAKIAALALAFSVAAPTLSEAARAPESYATVQVTVIDHEGRLVQDAPIYIYGKKQAEMTDAGAPGSTVFKMKPGEYQISSAVAVRGDGYVDRFSSPVATLRVTGGDHVPVILRLNPIDSPFKPVSYQTLRRLGVDPALANRF